MAGERDRLTVALSCKGCVRHVGNVSNIDDIQGMPRYAP